jgi:hypothetical protein
VLDDSFKRLRGLMRRDTNGGELLVFGQRRMSMTFNDGANERRERGRVRLQGRKTRALSYGECLYDAI